MNKNIYILDPENKLDASFAESVNKFYDEHYGKVREDKKQKEKKEKLASGEWIEVDGKIYDARHYKQK